MKNIEIKEIQKNIFIIKEINYKEHCNCYLIIGSEKCLLIDLGIGIINISEVIKPLIKNKELITIVTHFHFDHIGGSKYLDEIYGDITNIKNKDIGLKYLNSQDFLENDDYENSKMINININKFKQIKFNKKLDIGGFKFKIFKTYGHDKSSICIYEEEKRILFSGDLIYDGKLIYDLTDSDKNQYIHSLNIIKSLKLKKIYGGHNEPIINNIYKLIDKKIKIIKESNKQSSQNKLKII